MVELVVFDLDGTLIDTAPDLYAALSDTLADYGVKPPPFEEFKRHIGGGAYGFIAPFLPHERWEEALQRLRNYYLERYLCRNSKPFEGIGETLSWLRNRGIALAVATNKITDGAVRVLEKSGLLEFFELVVGRDLPREHKPSPLHLLYINERLKVPPEKTLMVGDRSDDILTALRAGAYSAYALWGYNEPLENIKPHYLLKKPTELKFVVDGVKAKATYKI